MNPDDEGHQSQGLHLIGSNPSATLCLHRLRSARTPRPSRCLVQPLCPDAHSILFEGLLFGLANSCPHAARAIHALEEASILPGPGPEPSLTDCFIPQSQELHPEPQMLALILSLSLCTLLKELSPFVHRKPLPLHSKAEITLPHTQTAHRTASFEVVTLKLLR